MRRTRRKQRVRDDLVGRSVDWLLQHDERRRRVRMPPDGRHQCGQRRRIAEQHHWARVIRGWTRLPSRRTVRAVEHVGVSLVSGAILPEHERLGIREPRERPRRDLEHAVWRILVEISGVEWNNRGDPRAFHVGAERRAHERERLVGATLDQQVRAAAPLPGSHVAKPHERHRCREHRHHERHDDREAHLPALRRGEREPVAPAACPHRRTSRSR